MNRNRYRLVFNTTLGMMVPVAEIARTRAKAASGLALAGVLLAGSVQAELPAQVAGAGFVTAGQAAYQANGAQAYVNQVGDKSILNWQTFNVSAGHNVQFRQVDNLTSNNLVQGANFTSLNRIWDINPSVIAGSISQAAGQKANVILVNSNGIAFMGGSQVNLNSFTASTLNIADIFVKDTLLPEDGQPQFEKALDGGEARGFVEVFENAKITASDQGRVMLIAPTVVNKGKIEAPDGQVILAAGSKAFLRSASAFGDDNVRGLLVEVDSPADDKLGHVTNLGELTSPRGNVTMVGYAVNQRGIARATTSVVANGSVYLLAKDRTAIPEFATEQAAPGSRSLRGGRVVLGTGSLTEVLPDTADAAGAIDGTTGPGLPDASQVQVLGQDVRMEGGAVINAPSGDVTFVAMDNPKQAASDNNNPFKQPGADKISSTSRVHIADGARINVAGLENVEISAARNSVEVELRGDELKDTPINRVGPLRGEKAYADISRALANAEAGKSTLIAKDSLQSYQARLERGVAERSTAGGTVTVRSQGEAILESGTVIDLSGGSLLYTPATVKTTLLTSNGTLTDLADASAEVRYDGIATRYVVDYERWNVKEVIDLGQSYRYDPGYVEGKDAGLLHVVGMGGTVMQADVLGRTTAGELQRLGGTAPAGARLKLGSDSVANDYKLNQRIDVSSTAAMLPRSFGFGDSLPAELKTVLWINPASVGKDKIAQLEVFSNQAAEIRDALHTPQGGSVQVTARSVNVGANIEAAGGTIAFDARRNLVSGQIPIDSANVMVAEGVTLSARGNWVNQLPGVDAGTEPDVQLNGGTITLSAENNVTLEKDTLLDATSGGWLKPNGAIVGGQGGQIKIVSTGLGSVALGGNLQGHGLDKGGSLTLATRSIQIGGTPDLAPEVLNLDGGFFERGGFADYTLTGGEGLMVAKDTAIRPRLETLELRPGYALLPSGSRIETFSRRVTLEDRLRKPVNLTLAAVDPVLGDVRIGEGASIEADDKAKILLNAAHRVEILGTVRAAGGSITAELNRGSSITSFDPTNTIWLGQKAVLDVSGAARTYTDSRGLTLGDVLAGGKVVLNAKDGYVATEAGSLIRTSGAAPVWLDIPNEQGGLGRSVGSDAGTLSIAAQEGALLDGAIEARAGSAASNRGGVFELTLGDNATPTGSDYPTGRRVVSLAPEVAAQLTGLSPGAAIPAALDGEAKLSATALEAAGLDRISLKGRDAIRLENGLAMGANRPLALREIKLDSPLIETVGGNAALQAETVRLGNYDSSRQSTSNTPASGSGTLTVDAQLLELAGNQTFSGMERAELGGAEQIRLTGFSPGGTQQPTATLKSAADLVFHGAVVAPATFSLTTIQAPGRTIEFVRDGGATPEQPLSAYGGIRVEARKIVQGGNLWAPFGQLEFDASDTLTFKDGSLTSVAAAPGSLTAFGRVENGRKWGYAIGSTLFERKAFVEKTIRTEGATVDMQPGARFDLSGGGDLQAYEFTVGPGGSRDILTDKNTYAILPNFNGGFAPSDAQEGFDRASGEAVYLSGIPNLNDGVYTLLPAHYALLPGAYAVKLDAGIKDVMPGQAYNRQDGVRIVAGYVTDTRENAPKDARWQGIQVLTHDQVRARSEFTLARASEFFDDSRNRPQDAGLLSITTTGSGANALKLDAIYNLAAGQGGHGAKVDLSAKNLAIVSGSPAGIDPNAVQVDVDKLNALGAKSLLLGATRATSGDSTTLTVGADSVTLANDANHALKSAEVMLAAKDTVTLRANSSIEAQGDAGDAGSYTATGNGALVRAASTTASFVHSDRPDGKSGTLTGEAGSTIKASSSIALDATKQNDFQGSTIFADAKGNAVAGNLAMGATRVSFGDAPTDSEGLVFSQTALDGLNSLESLTLTSYKTFDLYGNVSVGGIDAQGKPTLQKLTLQGAGLAGLDNSGKTANLRATELLIDNPANATYTAGGALGDGTLAIKADRLVLGQGNKKIQGYSTVNVTANELIGRGTGETDIAADTFVHVARISGERGSDQTLDAIGKLNATKITADRALAAVTALGAKWALAGTEVWFDTLATLPSGHFKLTATNTTTTVTTTSKPTPTTAPTPTTTEETTTTAKATTVTETTIKNDTTTTPKTTITTIAETTTATMPTSGNLELGENAVVDVAGRTLDFFDVTRPSWGGTAEFVSDTGNVNFAAKSNVDVSAAAGGDAGTLIVRAANGTLALADGSLKGAKPADANGLRGEGARVDIDTGSLDSFSTLNNALNSGGFDGARTLRVRSGDVSIAATDTVKAHDIAISADAGTLDVAGQLDASGKDAGSIGLFASGNVNVLASARLDAYATGASESGGKVEIGTVSGSLDLAEGSALNVSGGSGGAGGQVLLRAPRIDSDSGVAVTAVDSSITGASSVAVEAVKLYDNKTTLTATGASSGATLSLATIAADDSTFAGKYADIKKRLGKTGDAGFHILSGVEVRSSGDLTLSKDWNLGASRAGGEPGVLTLRAQGNLKLNSNLSDGFSSATAYSSGTTPAALLSGDSWSYRLVAGADSTAADPLAVKKGENDFTLASGKLIRTGTGDIRIASGRDIKLGDNKSAIYTAGRIADVAGGFVIPGSSTPDDSKDDAQFSQGGGDIVLSALGDVTSPKRSLQLYSNWLFRQGSLNADESAYVVQPAWWVRFDQFQQGVGTLGGGDITIVAGGKVQNTSASAPTQARMNSATPDASALIKTGGGSVRVESGGDLLGGQYYADNGEVVIQSGGKLDTGEKSSNKPLYTILALGDAQAKVQASGDVNIHAVLNPQLVVQSEGASGNVISLVPGSDEKYTLFSTYSEKSGVSLESLSGSIALHGPNTSTVATLESAYGSLKFRIGGSHLPLLNILPPNLSSVAFQGDVSLIASSLILSPAPRAGLTVLATNSVNIPGSLVLSDTEPLPDAVLPSSVIGNFSGANSTKAKLIHAVTPVHVGDPEPVRIYAVGGDVEGKPNTLNLKLSKPVRVRAGRDVIDLGVETQHRDSADVSKIEAGRDVLFATRTNRSPNSRIRVGGPGRLEVTAGHDIDLGTSAGIVSRGGLDNSALPAEGADIHVAAGVGAQGVDYAGAIGRLVAALESGSPDDATLWQARWLIGNEALAPSDALTAVKAVAALDADAQRERVRDMVFTALRTTGRDSNNPVSPFASDFARGYAALETVFPGIGERNPDGSFKHYSGGVNLFASRIKTESGGNIEFIVPGGGLVVGLSNTPEKLVKTGTTSADAPDSGVLGIVTVAAGDIQGFSRDDMLVNQSRILTVGGGDVLLWSSEGDIDAGKGKKTASAVPPPIVSVDKDGNVTLKLQGAVNGAGIGALQPAGGKAGDVDLIAPKGTVNAGDAGIRAGNLNIAALVVLGADNISVSGTSTGTPVADTSAVTAASSGASNAGGEVAEATASLSQNLADAARAAEDLKQAFKPTFISAEVVGYGE